MKNGDLTIIRHAFLSRFFLFMVQYFGSLKESHQFIPNLVVKQYDGDDAVKEV